jgi:hypothetical protein
MPEKFFPKSFWSTNKFDFSGSSTYLKFVMIHPPWRSSDLRQKISVVHKIESPSIVTIFEASTGMPANIRRYVHSPSDLQWGSFTELCDSERQMIHGSFYAAEPRQSRLEILAQNFSHSEIVPLWTLGRTAVTDQVLKCFRSLIRGFWTDRHRFESCSSAGTERNRRKQTTPVSIIFHCKRSYLWHRSCIIY